MALITPREYKNLSISHAVEAGLKALIEEFGIPRLLAEKTFIDAYTEECDRWTDFERMDEYMGEPGKEILRAMAEAEEKFSTGE